MRYYEAYVAEAGYQKQEPLTYCYDGPLPDGALVLVPYGRKTVPGFITREVSAPEFKTKGVSNLLTERPLPAALLRFHQWLQEYYPSGSGALTQAFIPTGLQVKPRQSKAGRQQDQRVNLPGLTKRQQTIIDAMNGSEKKNFLLHGETGSGKTRVYLERAHTSFVAGRSALILVPEISLVPQLADFFASQLGDSVVILHSGLTRATRNKNWLRILHADGPLVVIGTRSALFAPLEDIGFIAVDEMHEPAYKQESAPRYYALRAAAALAKLHGAEIVYGSATPPVNEYYIAEQTGIPILRMQDTARKSAVVAGTIIDLKDSKLFSRHRSLSDGLLNAIEKRLAGKEQSLLFLNRRGSYRTVLCQRCGWQALCPRCDMPLTYHGDRHQLQCHTCGYHAPPPFHCPTCGSDDIVYRSLGTKAIVDALQSFFPEALIRRFDTDNRAEEQLSRHFEAVRAGEVDILVGTQMLGKGLDLPKLSLVGIINADTSLGVPDFSSSERSYQLLHQAIGRVGRGHLDGEVIVQSFHPENPLLRAALERDWRKLYESELAERQTYGFPPFYFLLKISVSRKTAAAAEAYIGKLHAAIRAMALRIKVEEPTPGFYERSHGAHNWQLIIRAKNRGQLLQLVDRLPKGDYVYDLDPINLL